MKARLLILGMAWGLLASAGMVMGQTIKDPGEGLCALPGSTAGVTDIRWWGKTGRTYFLQINATLNPATWTYMPVVETGGSAVLSYSLGGSVPRQFARLVYTDQPTGGNAGTADFDGDGISNAAEVAAGGPGTDPLLADSDWDGYNDGAEVLAGTGPRSGQSNPGSTPPATGPLNPDARYRHGLRLDMAAKYMLADDETSTFNDPTSYDCSAYSVHVAGSNEIIFNEDSTTTTLRADCQSAFDGAGFKAPSQSLFYGGSLVYLRGIRSDYISTGTGPQEGKKSEGYFRERWEMQVQAQASPAAPSWARRNLALLLFKDYSATQVEAAGWLMLSRHNTKASSEMSKHCTPEGAKVVISPWLDPDVPDLASSSSVDYRYINRYLQLFDTDIEPAADMIGVVGDMVRSKKDDSHVKHFVTPKKSTELPQDYVELKCGVTPTNFDTYFEWEGGTAGSAANLRKVSRSTAARTMVKIKNKQTGTVVAEMHVWVVWCDPPTLTGGNFSFEQYYAPLIVNNIVVGQTHAGARWKIDSNVPWKFVYTIQPAEICDTSVDERPDLEGDSINPVPGDRNNNLHSTNPANGVADNAINKWDVSRQMQIRILNPDMISKSAQETTGSNWYEGQPDANRVPVPFPTNPVEGNDDPPSVDEDTNPYQAHQGQDLDHDAGQISSIDAPAFIVKQAWGVAAYRYGVEANFREFCRLEIFDGARTTGKFWFKISDNFSWHHYLHAIYADPPSEWQNDNPPSSADEGHPHL